MYRYSVKRSIIKLRRLRLRLGLVFSRIIPPTSLINIAPYSELEIKRRSPAEVLDPNIHLQRLWNALHAEVK